MCPSWCSYHDDNDDDENDDDDDNDDDNEDDDDDDDDGDAVAVFTVCGAAVVQVMWLLHFFCNWFCVPSLGSHHFCRLFGF